MAKKTVFKTYEEARNRVDIHQWGCFRQELLGMILGAFDVDGTITRGNILDLIAKAEKMSTETKTTD